MNTDLYQIVTAVSKPTGIRVSYYKTDVSCGCQGDLRLVLIETISQRLSKAQIVEAIENKNCIVLR